VADDRSTLFEAAGGEDAFLALAQALHTRCVNDEVLSHPFSHATDPDHVGHLAHYLAQVCGGPRLYSSEQGGHGAMLALHASTGATDDMADRFVACFDAAIVDVGLDRDPKLVRALHDYMTWAAQEVRTISPLGSVVDATAPFPYWGWEGPLPGSSS